MRAIGPLPWDLLTDPSGPHGVNSAAPYGAQILFPMLTPTPPGNVGTDQVNAPPMDATCWSPILDVPSICEPFWQCMAWQLTVSVSFKISGISEPFSGSGSVTLSPVIFTTSPSDYMSDIAPPPFFIGANIAKSVLDLPRCCGFASNGIGGVLWAPNSGTGYPGGVEPVVAGYLQHLLMTPPCMVNAQTCPVLSFAAPYDSGGGAGPVFISTGPALGGNQTFRLSVRAGSPWPAHEYTVPLSISDPNGEVFPTVSGSATLQPTGLWTY